MYLLILQKKTPVSFGATQYNNLKCIKPALLNGESFHLNGFQISSKCNFPSKCHENEMKIEIN